MRVGRSSLIRVASVARVILAASSLPAPSVGWVGITVRLPSRDCICGGGLPAIPTYRHHHATTRPGLLIHKIPPILRCALGRNRMHRVYGVPGKVCIEAIGQPGMVIGREYLYSLEG